MKTNIINIGNSQGIILPAQLLRKFQITAKSEVDIFPEEDAIIIKPRPRRGWEEQFEAAGMAGKTETDVFEGIVNDFDREEWEW